MIRKIAILCAMVHMVATTQLAEVLKLPIFIEHYIEYDKGGFIDYLVHHYGGHEQDADWETDQKLPFMNLSHVLMVVSIVPEQPLKIPNKIEELVFKKPILKHVTDFKELFLSGIFQPPRFC